MKKKLLSVSIIFFMLSALFALHCAGSFSRGILRAGQAGAFSDALYDMLEIYGEKSPSSDDSPYATKRIFVKTSESLNPRGAVMTARFGDVFVLQYATETAASAALEYYLSLTKTEFAEIDSLIKIAQSPEYLDSESLLSEDGDLNVILEDIDEGETVAQAEGENYLSWGAAHIGVDIYTDYLSQVVGANNLNEVVVAVIDTGIDATHPLFDGRIASGGKNFSSSSPIGYEYRDENGHGTHVGGIISDLTPQNVKILPLKVINAEGVAAFSAIIASVYYAAELKLGGVNIVAANFSLSGAISTGSTSGSLYKAALENLRALNILPVSAAGNDNRDALSYAPGNVESSITVSSVEYAGGKFSKAQSSNYGSSVDLCAPGVSIRSAKVGGGYVYMSGTSMAAPHVSAVIALLLSNPANENMSAKQLESYLKYVATDLGAAGRDDIFGNGLINTGLSYFEQPSTAPSEIGDGNSASSADNENITDSGISSDFAVSTEPLNDIGFDSVYSIFAAVTVACTVAAAVFVVLLVKRKSRI